MRQRFFKKAINHLLFLFICIALTSYKTNGPIVLSDEPMPFKPGEYYIAGVTDERVDKNTIAQIVIHEQANKPLIQATDLQGGAAVAIGRFIEHNLSKDQSLRPVIIKLKEFKLTEANMSNGSVDGHIRLFLSFGLQKDYGVEHLVDYHGGLHYTRYGNNTTSIEPHVRSILKNSLVYFNDWMKANVDFNRKLAKNVQISFTNYTEQPEGDTIYYSAHRPLTWDDFQSKFTPRGNVEAEVMPSIGYNYQAEIIKGTINVHLAMKAYVPKSACWANYSGRDDYALNHEQRHFDIVKIITEQFKQKVLAEKLTPDTFEAFINMQ
ncbi:MAG: hypothetical protein JWR67_2702, partial [Mucilaginibacter sp.]|nr:hypothetical protein [Mucilaginibacter sp.]